MSSREPTPALGPLLKQLLGQHPSFAANPFGDWAEYVGEQVARYSLPLSLKKKVLVIVVPDSVWKHHLELNKEALLERLNGKQAEPLVEKIVIRVGELPEAPPVLNPHFKKLDKLEAKRSRPRRKPKSPPRKLTEAEQAFLKTLPDPELRAIGSKLLKHCPPGEEET